MSSSHNRNFSFFPMAITLVLAFAILFVSPSVSTSPNLLDHPCAKTGFQVTLKHVDFGGNFTKLELLQRAMKRGRKRMERLNSMALSSSDATIEAPIHAGNGEFLMELSIGTSPEPYSAILDTGSDLIWTQCKPCKKCYDQPTPIFDPSKSSTFSNVPCASDVCSALPQSSCSAGSNCEYEYTYGDYSSTQGTMAKETFTFGNVSVPEIAFGCGSDNEGAGFNQGSGLVGMGRGPLSLVSQLNEPKFSYCLTSIDSSKTSTLLMGSQANYHVNNSNIVKKTTPLIKSTSNPTFYYLSLEGITIGDKLLPIEKSTFAIREDGSGGMIIDSGTTLTYLEDSAFDIVKKELIEQMTLPVVNQSGTGLELCFDLLSADHDIEVPKFVFHFEGADLELPGENYIIADSSGEACLAMARSNGMSIFGNVQQQNILMIHDLVKETISFVATKCDEL
ncbi:hypothetical protein ACP275_11G090200 [Erythranthe tilingii]